MIDSADFTKRIHKIMKKNELNASSFAEAISVGRSSISHILSGRNKPSLELVMNIIQQFPEVDIYWLLNGKGTYPKVEQSVIKPISKIETTTPPVINIPQEEVLMTQKKVDSITPDLFSTTQIEKEFLVEKNNLGKNITKVIILYSDGSFKDYIPE